MRKTVLGTQYSVLSFLLVLVGVTLSPAQQAATKHKPPAPPELPANVVTLASPSPLYEVQIMVRAGSAEDPRGKEGTASLVGRMMLEGGFGDPKNPVTKEKLAEVTRPWGEAAYPQVRVDKESTTFSMTVPRDAFPQFVARVLKPMLTQPLFLQSELERVRKEALVGIRSNLRFEQQEQLGLLALDDWVLQSHLAQGTVHGISAVTRDDLALFNTKNYQAQNMFVAASITDGPTLRLLQSVLPANTNVFPDNRVSQLLDWKSSAGRQLLLITQPNAIATGLHLGFPIQELRHPVVRKHIGVGWQDRLQQPQSRAVGDARCYEHILGLIILRVEQRQVVTRDCRYPVHRALRQVALQHPVVQRQQPELLLLLES